MSGDELVAFMKARLDEDEAAAKAWLPFGNPDAAAREHIARHDPARVLREVAAKRAILARHVTDIDPADALYGSNARCEECGTYVVLTGLCKTLRDLAAVYGDHPDYRSEWVPTA